MKGVGIPNQHVPGVHVDGQNFSSGICINIRRWGAVGPQMLIVTLARELNGLVNQLLGMRAPPETQCGFQWNPIEGCPAVDHIAATQGIIRVVLMPWRCGSGSPRFFNKQKIIVKRERVGLQERPTQIGHA